MSEKEKQYKKYKEMVSQGWSERDAAKAVYGNAPKKKSIMNRFGF